MESCCKVEARAFAMRISVLLDSTFKRIVQVPRKVRRGDSISYRRRQHRRDSTIIFSGPSTFSLHFPIIKYISV